MTSLQPKQPVLVITTVVLLLAKQLQIFLIIRGLCAPAHLDYWKSKCSHRSYIRLVGLGSVLYTT